MRSSSECLRESEVGKPGATAHWQHDVADLIRWVEAKASAIPSLPTSRATSGKNKESWEGSIKPSPSRRARRRSNSNLPLSNGDVVTIRQLPGWNDLGASISVKGEVKHPGTYGVRPGNASVPYCSVPEVSNPMRM